MPLWQPYVHAQPSVERGSEEGHLAPPTTAAPTAALPGPAAAPSRVGAEASAEGLGPEVETRLRPLRLVDVQPEGPTLESWRRVRLHGLLQRLALGELDVGEAL